MAYLRGIDVSKWQGTTPSLTGLSFLFARASIGTARDERYAQHIRNARAAGLYVGAYHFNWDTLSVAAQVDAFLAAAGDVDFYALDVEGSNGFNLTQTRDFISRMHAKGKKVGLYMSEGAFFWTAGQDWNWVANWSHEPARDWAFWQYRGSPLDLDYYAGTRADLARMANRTIIGPDTGTPPENAMRLTNTHGALGTLRMNAAGPVWQVSDEKRVDLDADATREVVGECDYRHPADAPDVTPGYMFRAYAEDGELHVVARSRVTFTPAEPDCAAAVDAATGPLQSKVAEQAKTIASLNTSLAAQRAATLAATAAERERIALAEAARVRGL